MTDIVAQRAAARRLARPAPAPAAPTPAIRKGAAPSRPRDIRGGGTAPAITVASTATKYSGEGWQTLTMPNCARMDIVAVRGDRIHFIKVVTEENKPSDGWRNQFIQNALSNAAEPIFADESGSLTNINESRRVVIARRTTAASSTAASSAANAAAV